LLRITAVAPAAPRPDTGVVPQDRKRLFIVGSLGDKVEIPPLDGDVSRWSSPAWAGSWWSLGWSS
jgi:site-specific DNA-cytosine methylase